MANYKLTPVAEEGLWRICQWSFRRHGEVAADAYYSAFFDRFEQIAAQPLLYPRQMASAKATEVACVELIRSIIALKENA